MEKRMLTRVSPGLSQDSDTGLFEEEVIYTIKLGDNKEIRYKTSYELYSVRFRHSDITDLQHRNISARKE